MTFVPPMMANAIDIDKVPTKCAGYVMEPKLDGIRCILVKQGKMVRMYSRTGHELHDKLPHIVEDLTGLDEDFVLDGEVGYDAWNPGFDIIDFNRTVRVTGSGVGEALSKQASDLGRDRIYYFTFDCLGWRGVDLRDYADSARREVLKNIYQENRLLGTWTRLGLRNPSWNEDIYTKYVQAGGEGVMLKNPLAPYKSSKRPANHWYKVKKFDTMDVVVCGYMFGQGKYEGQVGAVHFTLPGIGAPIGKCSGMDDATRADMTHHWDDYHGKVMEVKYFGRTGEGLRHPQFLRMRPDKLPEECAES